MHIKGYAAPETQVAAEQARLLIEQAEALGEAPEDPLLLFSVLYSLVQISWHSMATPVATSRRNSFHLPRSKARPFRSWSGMKSWAFPWCLRETLRKGERISIAELRFTILPSIIP